MRKRFSIGTLLAVIMLSLGTGAVLHGLISADNIYDQITKFKDVLSITEKNYVDEVDGQKLTEAAINGLLGQLDPHSVYIPASQMQRVTEEFQGSFEGIGIEFQVLNDTLTVVSPVVGGPSEALGIIGGDKIVRIDDSSCIGITQDGVQKKLRGPKGSHVKVSILRPGIANLLDFDITRDKIPIYTVDAAYMVDSETGYVSVSRFAATTHDEFIEALNKLQSSGMRRLVLDLRQNGGGYLEQAFKMVDELMPGGRKVVYTKGRLPEFDEEYVTSGGGHFENIPLIILVNNASASASEIVSGAIQDWDRGLIVGETTFGKGLVQRQYMLRDGSAFRLTTARYYTPSGRLIQRPYDGDKAKYAQEAFDRKEVEGSNLGHHEERDSTLPKYKTMGGRTVYGGGGITPDYIVKAERLDEYTVQLRGHNIFMQFANHYLEQHGSDLRKEYGKDCSRFVKDFQITSPMLDEIVALGTKQKVEFKKDLYDKDLGFIKAFTKAYIGRSLFGNEGSSRTILMEDNQFAKAMTLFSEAEQINNHMSSLH
ncbi:MAG: S41 family peptidase [Bacteroidota bacterium]